MLMDEDEQAIQSQQTDRPHLRKTGALQIQNCITDNVMNNNSLVHPGLTNVIGSAQEVNQKWGITHLWHYGLMKDHQDLLVHAAR